MVITCADVEQFQEHGYLVLESVIPPPLLADLQQECERNLRIQLADMERVGAQKLGLSHKDQRHFLPDRFHESPALTGFLFGDVISAIIAPLIGGDAWLFLDLFVVKCRHTGLPFGWHQDAGYLLGNPHKPYVTLWCALDDMTADNGTLCVLPYDRAGSRDVVEHIKDKVSNDLVGYQGNEAGVTLAVPKGSIIVLASNVFHYSGRNTTDAHRRAYLASFSPEPITDRKGRLWNLAIPVLKSGVTMAPPAMATCGVASG